MSTEPRAVDGSQQQDPPTQNRIIKEMLSSSAMVTVMAIVFALLIGAVLIIFSDPNVMKMLDYLFARPSDFFSAAWQSISSAYSALFRGAIFDWNARSTVRMIRPITETLVYATPLIMAGLAVAIPFRAGMFNIGANGQVILGTVAAGFIGYAFQLPPILHMFVAILGGMLAGAAWAGIAGWLKAQTGANEVIVTIMLNNIAVFLIAYLLRQSWFTRLDSSLPKSANIEASAKLPQLLPDPFRLHAGFIIALLAAWGVWWLLERSTWGFEFRAVGANPNAARTAGISVFRSTVLVMAIAGSLSGLAGANQILGTEVALTAGIAGSLGFDAITVALLGKSRPLGVVFSGLLFGALKAGSVAMASQTHLPVDIVLVVQSVIVLLVAAPPLVRAIFRLPAPGARTARKEAAA